MTFNSCVHSRLRGLPLVFAACLLASPTPLTAAEATVKPEPAVSREQQAKIDAAKTPEDAIKLGSDFFTAKNTAAAAAAIEKAIKLKPELLTDTKRQTPKPWNDFWLNYRATLQEAKLGKDDAASRVKIAIWLRAAGAPTTAAEMLRRALEMNKNLPEAQTLAKQWNLTEGGPVRFDLRYGLTQPLLLDAFKDEDQDVPVRKDRRFLLLPFAYQPGDTPLTINKTSLKITSDDKKPCAIKGLALLEGAGGSPPAGTASSATRIDLKLQQDKEPLWERIVIERKGDTGEFRLTCYNMTPAVVPQAARNPGGRPPAGGRPPPGVPRRAAAGEQGSGTSGKQEHTGSGYAAVLIDVPQAMNSVECEYRGIPPIQLEAKLLTALSEQPKDNSAQQREALAEELIPYIASKEGPIAAAAVGKLALLRSATGAEAAPAAGAAKSGLSTPKIDKALLTAMGHPDEITRQTAFDALIPASAGSLPSTASTTLPPEGTLDLIRTFADADPLLAMLDGIKAALAQPGKDAPNIPQPGPTTDILAQSVALLPPSTAPSSLFSVLAACLNHKEARVRERTLDILLSDGSRDSVTVLAKAAADAREILIPKLTQVSDNEVKAAIVRVLLIRADAPTVSKLLGSVGPLAVNITRDDDPLLTALMSQSSPESMQKLLELLGRSDLSQVGGSEKFRRILDNLAAGPSDPAVRSAMLKLALGQFKLPYEAPIKRERQQGGTPTSAGSGFESMLAALAVGPDAETANTAAAALFASGRIHALKERFGRMASNTQRQNLVQYLLKDKKLWEQEALPVFLASRLTEKDPQLVQLALDALALMHQRIDPKQRWRFNLAVKQGLDAKQLAEMTSNANEKISSRAVDLLIRLAMMPTADESEFKSATDAAARTQKLTTLEQTRSTKPAGRYGCMLYVDLKPVDSAGAAGADGASGAGANGAVAPVRLPRLSIPLLCPPVALQESGDRIVVVAEGRELQVAAPGDAPAPGATGPRTLRINAGPLLRYALTSPEAEKEGLTDKIDVLSLNEQRDCDMKYEQLGTWSGELNIQDEPSAPASDKSMRVAGAKIIFEPLPPN